MTEPIATIHVTDTQFKAMSKGIKLNEVRAAHGELEALCNRKIEATENFSNAVKLVALKAGVAPAVLSAYITAVCNETLKKTEEKAEQLSLLFHELQG